MSTAPSSRAHAGVSVIVPVYNPGAYISRTISSLLEQSLPADQLELIFVDDGSTDGAAELLDELAAEHPSLVVVRHIPNSGWPGRPRNIAVELARHDHIFFCDADDWLPPYSLELMLDRAIADDADIVIGRIVANKRRINIGMFESGDKVTTWRQTPGVFYNVTSQKLFRTSFLRDNNLRFPEGRARLEDFQYMTEAYLRSERISIIGSRPCYFLEWRDDQGNLTATRAEDTERLDGIERVAKVILANTEPGRDRDRVFERLVRTEIVGHATHTPFLRAAPEQQKAYLDRATQILDDYVPDTVVDVLDPRTRLRLEALRAHDLAAIADLQRWHERVEAQVELTDIAWEDGRLRVSAEVALLRDGEVAVLQRVGDRLCTPPGAGPQLDVTKDFANSSVYAALISRDNYEQWRTRVDLRVHPDATTDDGVAMRWIAAFEIDPRRFASGSPLRTGVWDLSAVVISCAQSVTVRVAAPPDRLPVPAVVGDVAATAYVTKNGNLSLDVNQATLSVAAELVRRGVRPGSRVGAIALTVPLAAIDAQAPHAHLVDVRTGRVHEAAATVTPVSADTATVTLSAAGLRAGRYSAALRWGGPGSGPMVPTGVDFVVAARRAVRTLATQAPGTANGSAQVAPPAADTQAAPRGGAGVQEHRLTDAAWVVTASDKPPDGVRIAQAGPRGWIVERRDPSPQAEPRLELETTQLLGRRHVAWLLDRFGINVVFDVGANVGQYASHLRQDGYTGHIVSFEPVPQYAEHLRELSASDDRWTVQECALGEQEDTLPMHVQSVFSSLLDATEYGRARFHTLEERASTEPVQVAIHRLDALWDEVLAPARAGGVAIPRVYLKLDTQGFDLKAFGGLGDRLDDIIGLQSEMSLLPIYEHMPRLPEALAVYERAGFEVTGFYPVTREPDGRVIEFDCTMIRADRRPS